MEDFSSKVAKECPNLTTDAVNRAQDRKLIHDHMQQSRTPEDIKLYN